MREDVLENLKTLFGDKLSIFTRSATRIYVDVPDKVDALDVVKYLVVNEKLRFSIATGIDVREGIEMLYHLADDKNGRRISVRTMAAKPDPSMPSATPFMQAAEWIEREIHELLGVDFVGHPNLKRLLLPDDWPEGKYPLRKGEQ